MDVLELSRQDAVPRDSQAAKAIMKETRKSASMEG